MTLHRFQVSQRLLVSLTGCQCVGAAGTPLNPHPAVISIQAALRVIATCQTVGAIRDYKCKKIAHSGNVAGPGAAGRMILKVWKTGCKSEI